MWLDRRYIDLVGIEHPIVQAPMAGSNLATMTIAVSQAGGLGSLPCGRMTASEARTEVERIRQQTDRPWNMNFFAHEELEVAEGVERGWRMKLAAYYKELSVRPDDSPGPARRPFDAAMCDLAVAFQPKVVSFQFGLPARVLVDRLKAAGCLIQGTATTVEEACWLEDRGADAIVAQGYEAGGHRAMFLSTSIRTQVGTIALVPQVVDAVSVPVVAAGGIADARGIAAALMLGASAVQIGSAYLLSPEATVSAVYRAALLDARDDATVLTNVLSGRPARSLMNRLIWDVGPLNPHVPAYPRAAAALGALRAVAEASGSSDFSPLWAGQATALAREMSASELTRRLAGETLELLAHH